MLVYFECLNQLFISAIHVHKSHVNTGNHHIFCHGITKIKDIVDHLFFFVLDDAIFLTHIDNRTEFMLRHGVVLSIGINTEQKHNTVG